GRAGGGTGARPRLDSLRIADHLGPYHGAARVSVGPGAARAASARVPGDPFGRSRQARLDAADLRGSIEGGGRNGPAATRDARSGSLSRGVPLLRAQLPVLDGGRATGVRSDRAPADADADRTRIVRRHTRVRDVLA